MNDPRADRLTQEFCRVCTTEFEQAVSKIRHCLAQLGQEQLWWRPEESMNSIANLIVHLCGNARQWIVTGLPGLPDRRNRPEEFSIRDGLDAEALSALLDDVSAEVRETLAIATAEQLTDNRTIQGFEVTGMQAVIESLAHFRGHTQEITHLTRIQLGPGYRFDFIPGVGQNGNDA